MWAYLVNDRADELAKRATGHADIDVDCRLGPAEINSMILDSINDEIDKKVDGIKSPF